jgi:transcription antitermination factor NusG
MSTRHPSWQNAGSSALLEEESEHWYAVLTRARHEKHVAQRLCERGVTTFLPTIHQVHRWADRSKKVELPLFNCYLFVRFIPGNEERQKVLRTDSVLALVGAQGLGTPIPSEQINAVRVLVNQKVPYCSHPFLKTGQRVRIRGGALEGLEGILHSQKGDRRLIISVDAMQRSLAIQVEGYNVEPV